MVTKTSEYYTQFSSTVSQAALKKWTKETTSAESQRLKNPRAMDVMRAHRHEVNTDPPSSGNHPALVTGVGTEWLSLALSIEERQYVFCH